MVSFVTITSQGQISIPAKVRRMPGFDRTRKAIMDVRNGRVIIEPAYDVLSLAGSLKDRAIKGKPIREVIKVEKRAYADAVAEKSRKVSSR